MSGYKEDEFSEDYDKKIREANELINRIDKYPEFEPFKSLAFRCSYMSRSCMSKLVAAYMPNGIIPIASSMDYEFLLGYINQHMGKAENGRNLHNRIVAVTKVFDIVHRRIDFLEPEFGTFLERLNGEECFDLENVPSLRPSVKERFCSPVSFTVTESNIDGLFFGLPDSGAMLDDQELWDMSKEGLVAAKKRINFLQRIIPNVLERFYEAFLLSFVERYFDFGGFEDASDVCLDDQVFFNATIDGLKAVENLQWEQDLLERTKWMSAECEDTEALIPQSGGSVFTCNFCGAKGMQWTELFPGNWAPFDLKKRKIHQCQSIRNLTRNELLQHLQNLGFEVYVPRTNSWKYAFTHSNKVKTIYFLVGKRGIDFKWYDYVKEIKLDEKGKLFTNGGEMVRNYYHDSAVNINKLILELASRFVTDSPINNLFMEDHGKSWKEQKAECVRSLPEHLARSEMKEIYEAISLDDGEDAYLGDGIWISSDGSLDDRGS